MSNYLFPLDMPIFPTIFLLFRFGAVDQGFTVLLTIGKYAAKLQARKWSVVHFIRLLAVW